MGKGRNYVLDAECGRHLACPFLHSPLCGQLLGRANVLAMTRHAFDLERFIADCREALGDPSPQKAVRSVMQRALAEAPSVRDALAEPRAQVQKLHVAADLVILNVIWAPEMMVMPHNHNMWAIIGPYDG